jgi:hypothetical protein
MGAWSNVAVVIAIGVNTSGQREVLGLDVGLSEDGACWLAFLRSLVARGLSGVKLVTSDAHQGLKAAIAATLQGRQLAAVPHAFHEVGAGAGAEERPATGGGHHPHRVVPARCGFGP